MAKDRISSVVLFGFFFFFLKAKLQNKPTSVMDPSVDSLNTNDVFATAQHLKGLSITKTSKLGEKTECWWKDRDSAALRALQKGS